MPDNGGDGPVAEGMDQANSVSGQVDRAPRRQVLVIVTGSVSGRSRESQGQRHNIPHRPEPA